ncbi:hypothetical protein DRP77_06230 [Candidatus Poribacteria bacterium]|nr:MAG: hypothetical protein DRP77_06230 [Candidatus Poribacteria bacterium]
MRFLADENFPLKSVFQLRKAGYDVKAIAEGFSGAKDKEVLSIAAEEKRILLTFDRDYGELIYRLESPVPEGVIFFRFTPSSPQEPADYVLALLRIPGLEVIGMFTVVERDRVRQRPLPRRA